MSCCYHACLAVQLPFIIVNTSKETVIDCSISNDKREYLFNFDDTFEIHDDMEVLKRMGLGFGLERGQVKLQVYITGPLFYHSGKNSRAFFASDLKKNNLE